METEQDILAKTPEEIYAEMLKAKIFPHHTLPGNISGDRRTVCSGSGTQGELVDGCGDKSRIKCPFCNAELYLYAKNKPRWIIDANHNPNNAKL